MDQKIGTFFLKLGAWYVWILDISPPAEVLLALEIKSRGPGGLERFLGGIMINVRGGHDPKRRPLISPVGQILRFSRAVQRNFSGKDDPRASGDFFSEFPRDKGIFPEKTAPGRLGPFFLGFGEMDSRRRPRKSAQAARAPTFEKSTSAPQKLAPWGSGAWSD